MARNITARFDVDLIEQLDAVSDVLGITISEFLRQATRHELEAVGNRDDFQDLILEEKRRQDRKFAVIDSVSVPSLQP